MRVRLGPGPVFVYEGLTAARRWQPYAMRAAIVGLMLIGMATVHGATVRVPDRRVSLAELALLGRGLYEAIAQIELTLVLLAAPAATAGAICLDRARGTLDHMLATDLSNAEIVLGKLGIRILPVLGLIACTLPVLAIATLLGGIDPILIVGLSLVAVGTAFAGCSLAMALSLYGRKTHEVVMMSYVIIIAWVMASPVLEIAHFVLKGGFPPRAGAGAWGTVHEWLDLSNPYFLALAPYSDPTRVDWTSYPAFLAGCLGFSAAMAGLAMARVRRVALRQAGRGAGGLGGRRRLVRALARIGLPGPPMDPNPVAWREWHRSRPSLMMSVAWGLYAALGLLWVVLASRATDPAPGGAHLMVGFMNMIQVTIGLLLLSVGAATSLAEERVRGSLDVLLATPMSTRSILAGKWWGSFRRVLWVAIWPAATTAFLAHDNGYWNGLVLLIGLVLAHGAAITSLGLAVATWVARPGRAIATCVAVPVVLAIAWPILLGLLVREDSRSLGQALITGDPPIGVMFGTVAAASTGFERVGPGLVRDRFFLWMGGWIVVLGLVAAALFAATVATFDGCLGRIPDDGPGPPMRPRGRSSLSMDELLALASPAPEDE